MQFGRRAPVPGIVYNTTLQRPDSALALAMLHLLENKREAKAASVAVTGNGLAAAAFADAVFRFYQLGPVPNANRSLPVGLAADRALPPDPPAARAVLAKLDEKGERRYSTRIRRVSDSAEVTALMRNSLAYIEDGWVTVIAAAPVTYLARILDSHGAAALVKAKVKNTVLVEGPQDAAACGRLLAEWPGPLELLERDPALLLPAAAIAKDFAWAPHHPVADFCQAVGGAEHAILDAVAVLYAARPDSGLFEKTKGTLAVRADGSLGFTPAPDGRHARVSVLAAQRAAALDAIHAVLATKPEPPPARRRFTAEEIEKLRKEREAEQLKRAEEERKAAAGKK